MRVITDPEKPVAVATAAGSPMREKISAASESYQEWNINDLIDFVIKDHHSDIRQSIVINYDLAQKVFHKHGEKHPELSELVTALFLFFDDLLSHLKKEEEELFPNVRLLAGKKTAGGLSLYSKFGVIQESVTILQNEHLNIVKELTFLRRLTSNYLIPADACVYYRYLFGSMKEFEKDLMLHIDLENTILFLRAIQLKGKQLK